MTIEPGKTKDEILSAVAEGTMTPEEASVLLASMVPKKPLYLKISTKGAVSLISLQRFPVTLYADQWLRIFEFSDDIKKFIEEHRDELSWKSPPKPR